jgi:rubredoxin
MTGAQRQTEEQEDERAFHVLGDVLAGTRVPLDACTSKTMLVVLDVDTDTLVTPSAFLVHRGTQKQRRPLSYSRRFAPAIVSELMWRANVERVTSPIVIGLPAGNVPKVPLFSTWSYAAVLVWLVPSPSAVKLIVRRSPEAWREPYVRDIPSEGPFALRELPEWCPAKTSWTTLDVALSCPSCGVSSTRYRELADALVCSACGRSFKR